MNRGRGFRNNRRPRGRCGFSSNKRNYQQKYSNESKPVQLLETDVGITEYISDLEGFSGVLKSRYSDFHVNEISLDGEIAKFSSATVPNDFKMGTVGHEGPIPEDTPSANIPQETWTGIADILKNDTNEKIVEINVTDFDKDKRSDIHGTVKNYYKRKICASTVTRDTQKFIQFKKFNNADKNDIREEWPKDKGEYVHFLVYKENVDTLEAALKISDCLRMKAGNFTYAGVKDRRAKTTQWFCVKKVDPKRLINQTRRLRYIHIGNITFKDKPLKLGNLLGNRFRIALKNVTVDDELINRSMKSLEEKGFINYYGLQRFGNDKEVPTHEIGLQLLLGKFREACDLILKCKKSENVFADISKAKKKYEETRNAIEACKLFSEREENSIESKLLIGLSKVNKNDYVTALENIPRNMRLLYIHAFQGFVWNKIVSRRIKEFGLKAVVGDLVLIKNDESGDLEEIVESEETSNEIIKEQEMVTDEDKEEELSLEDGKPKQLVKILTEDDLENYSVYDVVLPLPGYDITYPDNCVKVWYKEILEEHGLSLEMPKQSVKSYTLSGNYRNIVRKVKDLSWKIVRYDDPNDTLIQSDFEEFLGKPVCIDNPAGTYKALLVDFCLSSSCYATMVIREILKTDTSPAAHTKLNNYHSNPATTMEAAPPLTTSLLEDPEKYADFVKSVFGDESSDATLKRKTEDDQSDIAEKRSKLADEEKL